MTEERGTAQVVARLAQELLARKLKLVTAESCTGGLVAGALTEVAGSSAWFYGGLVTYSLDAKQRWLGVQESTLTTWGAVSEPTAIEMAKGALAQSGADLSVAVTGIAGPDGGSAELPTGTVWCGWALRNPERIDTAEHVFPGNRSFVREAAVRECVEGCLRILCD